MFVVAGVSGNTGSIAAEALLSQKKPVRVLVRDPKKGSPWRARGAEVAVADLGDARELAKALRGAKGVYLLSPPDLTSTSMLASFAARTDAMAKAVSASGIGHVVFLSSIGAQHTTGTGPIRSLNVAEAQLAKAAPRVTFIRAAYFMENWASSLGSLDEGVLTSFLRTDLHIPMVATADVGRAVARALVEGTAGIVELAGPREYSPRDVAEALARVVGRPITVREEPEEAFVPIFTALGVSQDAAELYREMTHGLNTGHVSWVEGTVRGPEILRLRGVVTIDDVLKRLIAA